MTEKHYNDSFKSLVCLKTHEEQIICNILVYSTKHSPVSACLWHYCAKFPKNKYFLAPHTHTYVCLSEGKKIVFRKFWHALLS